MFDDLDDLYARFCDRTLPRERWTHEAHLAVCWLDAARRPPAESLVFLRGAIRSYNDAVGTPNTDDDGYHETLTTYFVGAVHTSAATDFGEALTAAELDRAAPQRHWSRALLFSVEARRRWVEPDLEPLPWTAAALGLVARSGSE
ncbi:MAG: hypothetical protein AAGA99_15760 [Actinomycetota bacterium]